MKTELKSNLLSALDRREKLLSELRSKGLLTRMNQTETFDDRRHAKYPAYRQNESDYFNALGAAEDAGLIKVHNRSFSWL